MSAAEVTEEPRARREVVSFVPQRARMTDAQDRAYAELGPRYLVDVRRGLGYGELARDQDLDWAGIFGRTAPLIVEIGPGSGDSLTAMAAERPWANIVGFEVFRPGLAATMMKLAEAGVGNVRLIAGNGVHGLEHCVAPRLLREIWVFFPDPWPKNRHHKRRLIAPAFAELAASRLETGGRLLAATDVASYAAQMRRVLDAEPALENTAPGGWAARPEGRPVTRFEGRGAAAGRPIHDLHYVRR